MVEVYLVFHEPEKVENIGSMARLAKNFDVKRLILINPKCDPFSEKAYIVAKHAKEYLDNALILKDLKEAIKMFDLSIGSTGKITSSRDVVRNPITPRELSEMLKDFQKGSVGLFIGRESIGFTNEELKEFDVIVTIPASEKYPILNASHAAAILLYETFIARKNSIRKRYGLATRKQKEILYKLLEDIINRIPLQDYRKPIMKRALINVINKAKITVREASIMAGFLRNIKELISNE